MEPCAYSMEQIEAMQNVDIRTVDPTRLRDIRGFKGVGGPVPRPGNQAQHTGEGRAAQEPVGVDNGAGGRRY